MSGFDVSGEVIEVRDSQTPVSVNTMQSHPTPIKSSRISKHHSRSESPEDQPHPRVLRQELKHAFRGGQRAIDIDLENGLSANEDDGLMIVGAENTGQTQESVDSNRINSFNRLYYDGLQQIISRQKAVNSQESTRNEIEASQMQDVPIISLVSDAVAKQMPQRPKKADQFQLYSTEWKKIRDAKVEQQRASK